MSKFFFLLFCLGLCWSQQAHASDWTEVAQDPTWLGLLQVHDGVKTGSPDFYWSPDASTAEQELAASLGAVLNPESRASFACRFPARFYFLGHRFKLAKVKEQLERCDRLAASIELNRIESINLVLVGSYLSNPASSFGHTLLRLRQRSKNGVEKDLSFNYGALIPPKENVAAYISKGILGQYKAAYSDQDPFVHDVTYNHLENRDSWSYTVRHSDEDKLLIALHLWEMAGAKFQYFFFSRNCAWQMANSLRLTLEVRKGAQVEIPYWTLPVDVVHALQDQGLVESVVHIPSQQRRLQNALARLSTLDAERFLQIVHKGVHVNVERDSPALINAVIDYYTWRNAGNALGSDQERRHVAMREQAVNARLQLPPETGTDVLESVPSPSDGNKPMKLAVGYHGQPELSWAVYSQGSLDPHTLGVGHIRAIVFDAAMPADRWKLDGFTFLDIERIQSKDPFGLNGFSPSWRVKLDLYQKDGLEPRVKGGLGWSHVIKEWTATLYGDLTLTTKGLRADPALSVVHRGAKTQSLVEISGNGQHTAALQFQIDKSIFVGIHHDQRKGDSLGLSIGRYW